MKSSRNIAVSIVVVIAIARVMFGSMAGYPTSDVPKNPDGKPNLAAATPRTPDDKPDLSGIWEFRGGGLGGAGGHGVGLPSASLAAHVPDCTGTDACISNDKSLVFIDSHLPRN